MTRVLPLALLLGLPLGCSVAPPDDGLELLTPREQLIRLSVDLRGPIMESLERP